MEATPEKEVVSAPAAEPPVVSDSTVVDNPGPMSPLGKVVCSTTPEVAEMTTVPPERVDVNDPARADESTLTSAVL
jgi:hypothetical protein